MIAYYLGQLHVSKTNYQAIKFVLSKMKKSSKRKFYSLPLERRKAFYKEIIRIHENNLKTYVSVMTGRF
jgi:hypothetical protein